MPPRLSMADREAAAAGIRVLAEADVPGLTDLRRAYLLGVADGLVLRPGAPLPDVPPPGDVGLQDAIRAR